MTNQIMIFCSLFTLVSLVGCGEGEYPTQLADEREAHSEALESDDAEFESSWAGLTQEELAQLEHDEGTDRVAPAEANDDVSSIQDGRAARLPSCLHLHTWTTTWGNHGRVINWNCGRSYRVKIIWKGARDGNCQVLANNKYRDEFRFLGKAIRVETCD